MPNELVNLFWTATVGLPRFILVFPAVAIALLRAVLIGCTLDHVIDAEPFLLGSIPQIVVIWRGVRYWYRRNIAFSAMVGFAVISEFVTLGFLE